MRGSGEFLDWTNRARGVPIEREIDRRCILLKCNGTERIGPCPKCGGDDRFSINVKKQLFNCRGCDVGGDVIRLVEFLDDVDFKTACTTLVGEPPTKADGKANGKAHDSVEIVVAEFQYHDKDGNIVLIVERREFQKVGGDFVLKDGKRDKTFKQKRPDPDNRGEWIYNVDGVRAVPYRLPELIEAMANDRPILIVEGEAKVDLLQSWNVAATCCVGGAKKWKPEHGEHLRGANVFLLPDNDNAGWEHAHKVGASLSTIAANIRVLALPDLPVKGDIVDWANAGGTREKLDALLAEAPAWQLPTAEDKAAVAKAREDALIAALAKTSGFEYKRELKKAAKELGVDVRDIDEEVNARRAGPLYKHWIVEPWPEVVDGDTLLRDIIRRIQRHVVCSHETALVVALWIVFAWVHDAATFSPLLVVTSAEPASGKTTLLRIISFLAPRSISTIEITDAALYRAIELYHPMFCIDEFDSVLANPEKSTLRSVINSGHTRGDGILRVNKDRGMALETFSTFCPKAIGMIGRKLPGATLTRCIFVDMYRRTKDEKAEKFKHVDDSDLAELRSRLCKWSTDNIETLRDAAPAMPDELENRGGDNWRMQIAIADLAGEHWGDQARAAAIKLERTADGATAGVRLLKDARTIHGHGDSDDTGIGSAELISKLTASEDSEWKEWRHGQPISPKGVATLLKGYGIRPEPVRFGGRQIRGYPWARFGDAWERYL